MRRAQRETPQRARADEPRCIRRILEKIGISPGDGKKVHRRIGGASVTGDTVTLSAASEAAIGKPGLEPGIEADVGAPSGLLRQIGAKRRTHDKVTLPPAEV